MRISARDTLSGRAPYLLATLIPASLINPVAIVLETFKLSLNSPLGPLFPNSLSGRDPYLLSFLTIASLINPIALLIKSPKLILHCAPTHAAGTRCANGLRAVYDSLAPTDAEDPGNWAT